MGIFAHVGIDKLERSASVQAIPMQVDWYAFGEQRLHGIEDIQAAPSGTVAELIVNPLLALDTEASKLAQKTNSLYQALTDTYFEFHGMDKNKVNTWLRWYQLSVGDAFLKELQLGSLWCGVYKIGFSPVKLWFVDGRPVFKFDWPASQMGLAFAECFMGNAIRLHRCGLKGAKCQTVALYLARIPKWYVFDKERFRTTASVFVRELADDSITTERVIDDDRSRLLFVCNSSIENGIRNVYALRLQEFPVTGSTLTNYEEYRSCALVDMAITYRPKKARRNASVIPGFRFVDFRKEQVLDGRVNRVFGKVKGLPRRALAYDLGCGFSMPFLMGIDDVGMGCLVFPASKECLSLLCKVYGCIPWDGMTPIGRDSEKIVAMLDRWYWVNVLKMFHGIWDIFGNSRYSNYEDEHNVEGMYSGIVSLSDFMSKSNERTPENNIPSFARCHVFSY